MKKLWVCVVVFGSLLCFGGATARAQDSNSKVDVFLGYSFMTSGLADYNQNMDGYAADITANLNRHLGFEGNFSGYNGSLNLTNSGGVAVHQDQDEYYFLFGPKVHTSIGKVDLFSHFLVGPALLRYSDVNTSNGYTIDSLRRDTPFSVGVGGGADWNFGRGRFGWRILGLDYIFSRGAGVDSGQLNNVRLETGFIVHL